MKEVVKRTYVAFDGKEFNNKVKCERYEIESSQEKKDERIAVILRELHWLKHGKGYFSLKAAQERVATAKKNLLNAARGKRRYTMKFAKDIGDAAVFYRTVSFEFERELKRKRELVSELKRLAHKFNRKGR